MITIAEAIEAEDAVQLTALLLPLPKANSVKTPTPVARRLCAISLALSAAEERGLAPAVASIVARGVLRKAPIPMDTDITDADKDAYRDSCDLLTKQALFESLDAEMAQLTTVWNASVPVEWFVSSSEGDLCGEILRARNTAVELRHEIMRLSAEAAFVSRRAREIRTETAVVALDALEADCSERARVRCAGNAAAAAVIARGNAISAKLRLLRAQVAAELYDPAAVSALKVAAHSLETRIATLEPDTVRAQRTLARYRSVEAEHPEEFAKAVREYRGLMRALDEKNWSMKELNITP